MSTSTESSLFSHFYGVALLVFVNIVWVAASEITRYLFIDLDSKRPLFFNYAKSCMLSLFLSWYCCDCRKNSPESESTTTTSKNGKAFYSRLTENENSAEETDEEDDILDCNTLTEAEFEPISFTDVESNTGDLSSPESQNSQTTPEQRKSEIEENTTSKPLIKPKRRKRRVRFNKIREVRRWPESLSEAATLARLPYNKTNEITKNDFYSLFCSSLKIDPNSNLFIYFLPLFCVLFITILFGNYFPFIYLILLTNSVLFFPPFKCFCHILIPSSNIFINSPFIRFSFKILLFITNAKIIHGFFKQYLNI
ncbi:hypothetical protein ACQ4LE_002841 [Meloidogyne hapla]